MPAVRMEDKRTGVGLGGEKCDDGFSGRFAKWEHGGNEVPI